MRLACWRHGGRLAWGPVLDDGAHDVSERWPSPQQLVVAATTAAGRGEVEAEATTTSGAAPADVEMQPPVPDPARIICVGVNYAEHAAESDRAAEPAGHAVLFTRFASSLVGHGQPIVRPAASTAFDYEGELAVVIGRPARGIRREEALEAVAGYSCFMDGTLRDFQRHTSQFTPGKNFDRSGAWGPWIVTADEVGDPAGLELTTTVDGEVRQHAMTSQLIHDIPSLVAYCSSFTTLEPGDVISTGTPGGVGYARTPPLFLEPGAEVRVAISRIGTLANTVVDE
jgi:2-keto-4-pentenoate hydratase/2-oxohepta-3-ene-1,7-dioic acid hydratase in catechol pathway